MYTAMKLDKQYFRKRLRITSCYAVSYAKTATALSLCWYVHILPMSGNYFHYWVVVFQATVSNQQCNRDDSSCSSSKVIVWHSSSVRGGSAKFSSFLPLPQRHHGHIFLSFFICLKDCPIASEMNRKAPSYCRIEQNARCVYRTFTIVLPSDVILYTTTNK